VAAEQVDIRDSAACAAAVDRVVERCGRVDILVNNAGMIRDNQLAAMDDDDVKLVLDTNVGGVFNVVRAVAPHMIVQRGGKIINLSSVAGEKGRARPDQLRGEQRCDQRVHTRARGGTGGAQDHGQRGGARRDRNGNVAGSARDGGRRGQRPASCSSGMASRRKWPTRYGSWPRALPITSPARSSISMAASKWSEATMATEITKDEINAVFPTVAETMADALGCDVDDIKLDVSLIEGLDAESIDFLDMVFRLERAFKIKIPRGKIIDNARGALSEAEFEQKGVLTPTGLAQLRSYLSEIPADRFADPMKVKDIPRLFTPETFCKLVVQAQREAKAAA
jgi:acyl carrier protein